jgi:hypothetical protein
MASCTPAGGAAAHTLRGSPRGMVCRHGADPQPIEANDASDLYFARSTVRTTNARGGGPPHPRRASSVVIHICTAWTRKLPADDGAPDHAPGDPDPGPGYHGPVLRHALRLDADLTAERVDHVSDGQSVGRLPDLVRGFPPVIDHLPAGGAAFYVPSRDLETDLAQVTALGGQVLLGRTAVDAVHWVAVCADPHGTRFVLVTTVAAPGETAPMSAAP